MICNCGATMRTENTYDYPKTFSCPKCGATLMIDNRGIQKWYSVEGKQGTYMPPENKGDF